MQTQPTVGILSPGEMGHAIGAVFQQLSKTASEEQESRRNGTQKPLLHHSARQFPGLFSNESTHSYSGEAWLLDNSRASPSPNVKPRRFLPDGLNSTSLEKLCAP